MAAESLDGVRYLIAVLNSEARLRAIRPLQALGEHNPRHFDKYVWQAPIPLYDEDDAVHRELVDLAIACEQVAAAVELPNQSFLALRRRVRTALDESGLTARGDSLVDALSVFRDRHEPKSSPGPDRTGQLTRPRSAASVDGSSGTR